MLIRVSDASSFAIHAMMLVAGAPEGAPVTSPEMARQLGISEAHLSKVMQRLARQKLVTSTRGRKGGFVLARPAKDISIAAIHEAIDGPIDEGHCLLGKPTCIAAGCILGDLVRDLHRSLAKTLRERTLADVSDRFVAGLTRRFDQPAGDAKSPVHAPSLDAGASI